MLFIRETYPAKQYFLKIQYYQFLNLCMFNLLLNKLVLVFHVTSMFYLLIIPDTMKIGKTGFFFNFYFSKILKYNLKFYFKLRLWISVVQASVQLANIWDF